MSRFSAFIAILFLTAAVTSGNLDADIVYNLRNLPTDQDNAVLMGTITTDGTIGTLTVSNTIACQFNVATPGEASCSATSLDSGARTELSSTLSLFANAYDLSLNGSLLIGRTFSGLTASILWNSSGVNEFYFSNFQSNASPQGWSTTRLEHTQSNSLGAKMGQGQSGRLGRRQFQNQVQPDCCWELM